MNTTKTSTLVPIASSVLIAISLLTPQLSLAAAMSDYCIQPPFVAQAVPPLLMFVMDKEHRLFTEAYSDSFDLDSDGKIETNYKHTTAYYGYFDPNKCYTYSGAAGTPANVFQPSNYSTQTDTDFAGNPIYDRFCSAGKWSGNVLNWVTMSRMDVIRKVLYGGQRSTDTTSSTILQRVYVPQDAHSFGKEFTGRLCTNAANTRSTNMCSLDADCDSGYTCQDKSLQLIGIIAPTTTSRYHLFCNKSTSVNYVPGPPLLRMLINNTNRIQNWISNEVVQCDNHLGTPQEFQVNVEVCNSTTGLESNCKQYGSSNKPIGLLQKYGDADGTKVCSKTLATACSTDSDCRPGSNGGVDLGMCVDKSRMYFGLLTGSYTHNLQGGVLRKNIWSISDEVDITNGIFKTSASTPPVTSNMQETFSKLRIVGYKDTSSYNNCSSPIVDGKCSVWGNPLAEMMYETLRYYSGKGSPTTGFDYPQTEWDGGAINSATALNLPHPAYWGYKDSTIRTFKGPYDVFPSCSKPFILLLSDVYPSFDADQLPGVTNSVTAEDALHPQLNLGTVVSGKKLLSKLADDIASNESVTNNNFFIGDNGTTYDLMCTAKTTSTLSLLRGLCPEQPTRKGSFYTAALAYYGHSFMNSEIKKDPTSGLNTNIPNTQTFVVAMASQVGNWTINVGGKSLRIVPQGISMSQGASGGITTNCYNKMNVNRDYFSDGSFKTLTLTPRPNQTPICPANEIVKVYTHSVKYDSSGNPIYLSFRVNYADGEQGVDYDMDAVGWYEVCTQAAKNAGYGTCVTNMNADQAQIKVVSDYSGGGIDQVLGFIVSGTSEDGAYLVVKDTGVPATAPTEIKNLSLTWSHIFTVSGSSANVLKDPLWYAAKWGGFKDSNGNNIPDLKQEWANNCTESDISKCDPDNYYLVTNPLKLEQQLEKAFNDILSSVSSGTGASILNNADGSGANLLQAVFYPKKTYENQTSVTWAGELMNLWYYVDPLFASSTIREDTDYTSGNHIMDIAVDKRIEFYFDSASSQTKIRRYNFDGTTAQADLNSDVTGGLKSIWSVGKLLWKRDISSDPRTIYTTIDSQSFTNFTASNAATLSTYLDSEGANATAKTAFATNVINYVLGTDVCLNSTNPCTSKSRNRKVDIKVSDTATESHIWKLGDIISSTPKIQSGVPLQSYDQALPLGFSDSTYKEFYSTAKYKNRGMVYVGANDGMLHAFKLGKLAVGNSGTQKATLSGTNLGREEWTFIPRNTMPYLKYLTLPAYDYNHLYEVDGTNVLFDISTITTDSSKIADGDYWNEPRTASTWKTVLLGGMGLGGASKPLSNSTCTAGSSAGTCVRTPFDDVNGFSSYFAIDVSNQDFNDDTSNLLRAQPTLLWEFSDPSLGYATSGPAMIRINAKGADGTSVQSKNGRWFAVYASGPTGPIDATSKQFKGKSDQNLKLFILDVEKGPVTSNDPKKNGLWIIDTGIAEAFAGSISNNATVDAEMFDTTNKNLRQDDVLYVGYTKKATDGTWTDGGVLRLVIPDSANPDTMWSPSNSADTAAWKTSKVIDGIGPVTTTVSKLMSKNNLYLFFGTGRYYYPSDDMASSRRLFMVKEKCYPDIDKNGTYIKSDITQSCPNNPVVDDTHSAVTPLGLGDLTAKNTPSSTAVTNGWYIDLDVGERVVTDAVATVNGAVFYTSYKPTADICGLGGKSYLWGVQYDTGNTLPTAAKQGKVLIQLSTGSYAEMNLSSALTDKGGRRTGETSDLSYGKASPTPGLFMTSAGMNPVKRILHIQERTK